MARILRVHNVSIDLRDNSKPVASYQGKDITLEESALSSQYQGPFFNSDIYYRFIKMTIQGGAGSFSTLYLDVYHPYKIGDGRSLVVHGFRESPTSFTTTTTPLPHHLEMSVRVTDDASIQAISHMIDAARRNEFELNEYDKARYRQGMPVYYGMEPPICRCGSFKALNMQYLMFTEFPPMQRNRLPTWLQMYLCPWCLFALVKLLPQKMHYASVQFQGPITQADLDSLIALNDLAEKYGDPYAFALTQFMLGKFSQQSTFRVACLEKSLQIIMQQREYPREGRCFPPFENAIHIFTQQIMPMLKTLKEQKRT
ncbi:MAG: hypothetical protein Q6373_008065 [Candidatus Sigynarchaeota archaeon]